VLTFADAEVIRMAQERFVPVAGDDWYERRRKDAEGEFFRLVSDQGPRKSAGASGTRQGIYVFTASGKLLAFRNNHDPAVMRGMMQQALKAWNKLPASERDPGAVKVDDAKKVDAGFQRKLPEGGIVVNVFTRILDMSPKGDYCHATCEFTGGERSAHDRLWLTREDWLALIPKDAKPGVKIAVPERIVRRIARFHLVDDTRGEPPHWENKEIRQAELTLEVTKVDAGKIEMKLTGRFLLTTDADADKAERGFDAGAVGHLVANVAKDRLERFDLVVLGNHWGNGALTRGARPGRTPLGIAFELSPGDTPGDAVPPQGGRWLQGYFQAETR
jgi:hypothetical protein